MKFTKLTGTHAGRIVLAAGPVALLSTVLMAGVANGAVPVSFAVSGGQFKISASQLDGTGFSQYAGVTNDTAGKPHQVERHQDKERTPYHQQRHPPPAQRELAATEIHVRAAGGELYERQADHAQPGG